MAKRRVFLILYIGLLCSINLALGEEYVPDPSLEEIKKMDAQEGLDRESLQCKDPTPVNGSIKVISGNPFHLYCKVDVMCDTGFHFPDGTTSINVTCLPFPNPYYIPQKDEDFYTGTDSKSDTRPDADRNEENPDATSDKRSPNKYKGASKIYQTINGSQNKDLGKRDTEVEVNDKATYETIKRDEYTNEQEQEMEQRMENVEEVEEELKEQVEKAVENDIEKNIPETGAAIQLIEPFDIENGEEINENKEETELNIELQGGQREVLEHENNEDAETVNQGQDTEEITEEIEFMNNIRETADEEINETADSENETEEELEISKFDDVEIEANDEDIYRDTKTHFTDVDSSIHVPEYLTEYNTIKDSEFVVANIPPEHSDPACYLPPKTGFCKAAFRRFYFNSQTKECEKFIYGGCGGNDNNFKTLEDCQQTCSHTLV